jgi:hypothetical protein
MNSTSAGVYEFRTLSARAACAAAESREEGGIPADARLDELQAAAAKTAATAKSLMTRRMGDSPRWLWTLRRTASVLGWAANERF